MASAASRLTFHGSPRRAAACYLGLALLLASCAGPHASATKGPAARYLAIATPANKQLDDEVDSYRDHEHDNLAIAKADLRREVATERRFDEQLRQIAFPPGVAGIAQALVAANNRRIALTRRQSQAGTLAELVAFDQRHKGADAAVEAQVRAIRKRLGLPPPDTS